MKGFRDTEDRIMESQLNILGVCKACTQRERKQHADGRLHSVFKEERNEKKAQHVASCE